MSADASRHASGFPAEYTNVIDRGVAARKCLSTLGKVRGVAVIIADAEPASWKRYRTGKKPPPPSDYGATALWIAAASFRDHYRLSQYAEIDPIEISEIKLRQTNLLALIGALPLDALIVAARELMDRARFERESSPAAPTPHAGKTLRL